MKKRSLMISLLLTLGGAGLQTAIAQEKPAKSNSAKQKLLRIDTNLVTLSVGVNDKKGNSVSGLKQENFVIHEDGKPQTIEFFGQEDEPISFGVLLDSSQSMEISGKMEKAVAVALSFLHAKGNTVIPIGKFVYQDFEASVTATFVTVPQRSTDPARAGASQFLTLPTIGASFRINPEGYYTLMLAPKTGVTEARYRIIKIADGRETEITGWRRYMALSLRNQIKLRCVGQQIELFINGMRLETLQDDAHERGGISLLFSGESATFDDLVIETRR